MSTELTRKGTSTGGCTQTDVSFILLTLLLGPVKLKELFLLLNTNILFSCIHLPRSLSDKQKFATELNVFMWIKMRVVFSLNVFTRENHSHMQHPFMREYLYYFDSGVMEPRTNHSMASGRSQPSILQDYYPVINPQFLMLIGTRGLGCIKRRLRK